MSQQALTLTNAGDQATDYELNDGHQSCWITVDNISVYICRTDEGVVVDLYPRYSEMEDSIAGTWASFNEAADTSHIGA